MDMLREDRLVLQRGPQQGPYPGMRPFEAEFREYFFGREIQIREVVQRLSGGHHFAAILGGSGCGKSSLIRAGVIPELRTGGIAGASSSWLPVIYTPEESPVGNLAAAFRRVLDVQAAGCPSVEELTRVLMQRDGLAELLPIVKRHGRIRRAANEPAAANLLVVVDQFEEIFRQGNRASGEAESLVTLLLDNFRNPDPQVYVILTLRSEDLHSCATYVGLPEALNCATYLVPRLHDHEIEEVIRSPAEYFAWKAGVSLDFDQAVCVRLIEETQKLKEDPDHLPLLQHLLFRLWRAALARESGGEGEVPARILPEDLDAAVRLRADGGGGEGGGGLLAACLDNHAEAIYHELAPAARQVANRMLPMLAVVDPSGVVKRNFLARDDLRAACPEVDPATIDAAVAAFTTPHPYLRDAGLLDVAHESFIRKWKRFYGAVSEEYQRARLFRGLVYLHQEWCQAHDADGARGLRRYLRGYARLPDRQSIARYDRYRVTRPSLEQVRRWVGQARVQPLAGETWESTLASLQAFLSMGRLKAGCRRGLAMLLALLVIGGTPVMVWQRFETERLAREGKALKAYMAASDSGQRANPEDLPEIRQTGMADVLSALEVLKASVGDGASSDPALRKVQWRAEVQISDALRRYTGMIWPATDPAPAAPPAERGRRLPRCDSVLPGEGGRIVSAGDGRAIYLPGDDTVHSAVMSGDGRCVESSRHLLFLPGAKIEVDRDLAVLVARVPPEIDAGGHALARQGSKLFFYALAWERTAPGGGWAALTPAQVGVLPANPALATAERWWVALDRAEAKGPLRIGLFSEENAPAAVSYRYLPPNWLPWVDPASPALREVWGEKSLWTPVDLSGPALAGSVGCGFAGAFGMDYCLRLEPPSAGESPGQPSARYLRFLPSLQAGEGIPLATAAVIGARVEAIDLGRDDLAGWLRVKADGRWHFGPWGATALAEVAEKMRGNTSQP